MLRAFGLGAILFAFWLLLSGHWDSPLLLGLGVASCALVVYLCVRMRVIDEESVSLWVNWRFYAYAPWLMKEILVANLAVAKIILSPKPRISPSIYVFHGSQATELGKALYANSITLTPGTITTGVEGQEFQIHALTAADLETDEESEMDRRVTWLERAR